MTVEDIIQEYKKRFGRYPDFNGSSFDEDYPVERVLNALESGVPISEPQIPEGIKA